MTRLAFGALGANSVEADGFTLSGVPTVVASPFTGGGPYALRVVGTAANVSANYVFTMTNAQGCYLRARVRISGTPTADTLLLGFGAPTLATTVDFGLALLNGSRDIRLWAGGAVRDVAGPTMAVDTDYLLELYCLYQTAANDTITGRLNGTQFATSTGAYVATLPTGLFLGLTANAGITAHYTDWAINDDQGATDNSWPGDTRVAFLPPVSDNTGVSNIGADAWRAGNTGTTNLFAAVDNAPPVGVASPGTTSSQIVCDTPSTTRAYNGDTAVLNTLFAAGDTLNLIQAIAGHAESASTGTKTGTIDLNGNTPSAGQVAITYGGDAGAAGTWPAAWLVSRSLVSGTSGVDRALAITVRVQANVSTRNSDVCFLGVYVDYTPVAPALPPELMGRPDGLHGQQQMHQLLSQ